MCAGVYHRNERCFKQVFERAGLTIKKEQKQGNFPKELFPVIMYVAAILCIRVKVGEFAGLASGTALVEQRGVCLLYEGMRVIF